MLCLVCYSNATGPGILNVKDFFTTHRLLAEVTIILNSNQLQSNVSDFTERAAFSISSGSVKVCKYSHYSIQFRFALCDFEKYGSGSVKVRRK